MFIVECATGLKVTACGGRVQSEGAVQFSDAGARLKTGTYASAILHEFGTAEIRGTETRVKPTVLSA